jgi:putative transcriptional regulator
MTKKKFKSDAFASIYESAAALHSVGAIDKVTLKEYEARATVETMEPEAIKAVRLANNVSQSVFADLLNTSLSTIQKWETGAKEPSGMGLKLLTVVKKHGLSVLG